jgi:signal transduction histidine kinase
MSTPLAQPALSAAYLEFDRTRRVLHSKAGCILALILMPGGLTLDWFVYPSFLWTILKGRLLTDVAIFPVFLLLFTDFGKRHIRILGPAWAIVCAIAIAWMIWLTEGAVSPYYAGLNLVILVTCMLMPFTVADALAVCSITIALYTVAILAHHGPSIPTRDTFNNYYFLILTSIIVTTASGIFDRGRREDFRKGHQLDVQNQQLNESYHKLAELDRLRSQFFANISHELRTPLTLILAPIEDLLRSGQRLPDPVGEALGVARSNALRLLKLINDLLELVRIDEKQDALKRETIDLSAFSSGITESVRVLADAQELSLVMEPSAEPLPISADPSRIEKILLNLLTNAIKFTPKQGTVTVATRRGADGSAEVAVSDTGVGIPQAELPYIFDRFRQVDGSSTRKYQGAGIGLALVKELVAEHGGRIAAASAVGGGTTLTISLPPLARGEAPAPDAAASGRGSVLEEIYRAAERRGGITIQDIGKVEELPRMGDPAAPLVLVVDDEPDMRRYLASRLAERYCVIQADHGIRAVELARVARPRLVLLDLMIPGIDGLEVCRRLRQDPALALTKIVMLTARADEEAKLSALRSGADDFLTKPFSTVEVLTRAGILLRTSELQATLQSRAEELEQAIRRLKDTEAALVQNEKMSAFGTIAAGLLHEINNPLNFTLTALQVALRSLDPQQTEMLETLTDIDTGMRRIKDLIGDLGMFAFKSKEGSREPFSLASVVESALRLSSHELKDIEVVRHFDPTLTALGSKTQISHVLINILINSARALAGQSDRPRRIDISAEPEGSRLRVVVRDSGSGIAPDVLPRIFEPFFTTRAVGKGMGLGLSICHTVIANHGGAITARSELGQWTEIRFDLPIAELTPAANPQKELVP